MSETKFDDANGLAWFERRVRRAIALSGGGEVRLGNAGFMAEPGTGEILCDLDSGRWDRAGIGRDLARILLGLPAIGGAR